MATFAPEIISTSPLVAMWTAPNPGPKTLQGTHTFLVGETETYVLDPGPGDKRQYLNTIYRWVRDHQLTVSGVLLTHRHPDHAPGTAALRDHFSVPVWSFSTSDLEGVERSALRKIGDGMVLKVDGDELRAIHTPGHTSDHLGFWLERSRIFFSGDNILGEGTTVIDPQEGDMTEYLRSLQKIRDLRPRLIAPGHGSLIRRPLAKIDEYVRHRKQREKQILRALKEHPAVSEELVRRVYTDVDPKLHQLAMASVEAQLRKLQSEGRVRQVGLAYELSDQGP